MTITYYDKFAFFPRDVINVIDYLFLKNYKQGGFECFDLKQIKCKNCVDKDKII